MSVHNVCRFQDGRKHDLKRRFFYNIQFKYNVIISSKHHLGWINAYAVVFFSFESMLQNASGKQDDLLL